MSSVQRLLKMRMPLDATKPAKNSVEPALVRLSWQKCHESLAGACVLILCAAQNKQPYFFASFSGSFISLKLAVVGISAGSGQALSALTPTEDPGARLRA